VISIAESMGKICNS